MSGNLNYSGNQTDPKKSQIDHDLPFFKRDQFTDTVLVLDAKKSEPRKFFVNRHLLADGSKYFRENLEAAHKAAAKKQEVEIRITDESASDILEMLAFLHPLVMRDMTERMALKLLPVAHKYKMDAMKKRCEKELITALKKLKLNDLHGPPVYKNRLDNTPTVLLACTIAAEKGESEDVEKQCLNIFAVPSTPLAQLKSSREISEAFKTKVYERRTATTARKINHVSNEIDHQKYDIEQLKKRMGETNYPYYNRKAFGSVMLEKDVTKAVEKRMPKTKTGAAIHSEPFSSYKRANPKTRSFSTKR